MAAKSKKKAKKQQELDDEQDIQEKVLVSWKAPSRPFKKLSRETYVTIISGAVLISAILYLIGEGIMPVLLVISAVFLLYVMSTVKPEDIEYEVTTWGVKVAGTRTPWHMLGRFWFTNRLGSQVLVIESATISGRTEMVVENVDKEKVRKALSKYLIHEEVPANFMDKTVDWMSQKLPDDK